MWSSNAVIMASNTQFNERKCLLNDRYNLFYPSFVMGQEKQQNMKICFDCMIRQAVQKQSCRGQHTKNEKIRVKMLIILLRKASIRHLLHLICVYMDVCYMLWRRLNACFCSLSILFSVIFSLVLFGCGCKRYSAYYFSCAWCQS